MKAILEFGVRGGAHADNLKVSSVKEGVRIAAALVAAFTNDPQTKPAGMWNLTKGRDEWQNASHYVALSKLDGVLRGSASAHLWRKPKPEPKDSIQ